MQNPSWLSLFLWGVLVCVSFVVFFDAHTPSASPQFPSEQKKSEQNEYDSHWVESGAVWASGHAEFSRGPYIHRQTNKPAIVFQQTSLDSWGILNAVPYVLVIDNGDSMNLLTDFSTQSHAFGVVSNGIFRSSNAVVG